MTKLAEIQEAILKLPAQEQALLREWLASQVEETPELIAALNVGIRSLREKGTTPLEEAHKRLPQWISKSA